MGLICMGQAFRAASPGGPLHSARRRAPGGRSRVGHVGLDRPGHSADTLGWTHPSSRSPTTPAPTVGPTSAGLLGAGKRFPHRGTSSCRRPLSASPTRYTRSPPTYLHFIDAELARRRPTPPSNDCASLARLPRRPQLAMRPNPKHLSLRSCGHSSASSGSSAPASLSLTGHSDQDVFAQLAGRDRPGQEARDHADPYRARTGPHCRQPARTAAQMAQH